MDKPVPHKHTANSIKTDLVGYAIGRDWICASEVGINGFVCDTLAIVNDPRTIYNSNVYEIEIKISMEDVYRDFSKKQLKHLLYKNDPLQAVTRERPHIIIPDYFYFCVPQSLSEKVIVYFKSNDVPYGGMEVYDKTYHYFGSESTLRHVRVVKRAKKLTGKECKQERNKNVLVKLSRKLFRSYIFEKGLITQEEYDE